MAAKDHQNGLTQATGAGSGFSAGGFFGFRFFADEKMEQVKAFVKFLLFSPEFADW